LYGARVRQAKRHIKTQILLVSAEPKAIVCWALLASGEIAIRTVDGWQMHSEKPAVPRSHPFAASSLRRRHLVLVRQDVQRNHCWGNTGGTIIKRQSFML
jgi:hypothetical protein